ARRPGAGLRPPHRAGVGAGAAQRRRRRAARRTPAADRGPSRLRPAPTRRRDHPRRNQHHDRAVDRADRRRGGRRSRGPRPGLPDPGGELRRLAHAGGGPPMIWLTWRQFRMQAVVTAAAIVALAAYLLFLGFSTRHAYNTDIV